MSLLKIPHLITRSTNQSSTLAYFPFYMTPNSVGQLRKLFYVRNVRCSRHTPDIPCHVTSTFLLEISVKSFHSRESCFTFKQLNKPQSNTGIFLICIFRIRIFLSMNIQLITRCRHVATNDHVFYRPPNLREERRNRPLSNIYLRFKMSFVLQEFISKLPGWICFETEVQRF